LMKLPIIYVFTHDSIAVGEDGPTHQPVEHLATLRVIPGLTVIRPADASETADAWRQAVKTTTGPVALILSRQKLPVLESNRSEYGVANGAYIVSDSQSKPDIILIATGSEVHIALEAQKRLADQNVAARVVSMPSWELFEDTTQDYQDHVLSSGETPRLAIEAGTPFGWERYVENSDAIIGITRFGASAPGNTMLEKYGFTPEQIVKKATELLKD
ncbi:MAG: transketolase, partial [Deltaproteobacteria bacterium]|nr:transketolase [Deltaproteobacteria bacterium]